MKCRWGEAGCYIADVYARRLSRLKDKLIYCFKSVVDMIRGGIREFVYGMVGPAFLKREMMGFGVDRYHDS